MSHIDYDKPIPGKYERAEWYSVTLGCGCSFSVTVSQHPYDDMSHRPRVGERLTCWSWRCKKPTKIVAVTVKDFGQPEPPPKPEPPPVWRQGRLF